MAKKIKSDIETKDKKGKKPLTDGEMTEAEKRAEEDTQKTGLKDKSQGTDENPEQTGQSNQAEQSGRSGQTEQSELPEQENAADSEDIQAKYVRLAADFQNFRRRTENEKNEIYAYANESLVKDLINVLDNFERAIDQAKDSNDQGYADGVALIYKQFKEILEKFGTQEIPALGEDFDPNKHHAVMMDNSGAGESGKVTEVFQKGYTLNSRVIRPSMVKVAE